MQSVPATVWREAFAQFERLLDLDLAQRDAELAALASTRPDLHVHVVALLEADARGEDPRTLGIGLGGVLAESLRGAASYSRESGTGIGPYVLEQVLGSGGMGEVWFARRADGLFEAPVALKLLHAHLAGSSLRSRFVREGKILGELTHPNIAHLLDAGVTPAGQLYLAIEHVEGVPLDRWCDDKHLSIEARVRLFLQVCDAVAHAHAHLVVHRDLKPSNILVTADGQAKLLDFGIAKLVESSDADTALTELTRVGGRVLTPEYAAPEQIESAPVSVATDVYSLGVILYVLLCGQRPYGQPGQSPAQLEREVLQTEPQPPSRVAKNRALEGDLDTIILKALKKHPAERYASVPALREDLQRYLDHRPVLARPDSFTYRARKYVRRNRIAVSAAAAVSLALVAGLAGTLWQAQRAQARAQELRQVVDFQGAMLKRADVARLGGDWMDRMRRGLQEHLDHDMTLSAAERARLTEDFERIRQWSQPTEVARQSLGQALLAPAREEIGRRFAAQDRLAAQLTIAVADGYTALGLYGEARALLEPVIAARAGAPGDPLRLSAEVSLANALLGASDIDGASAAAGDAAEGRARLLGPHQRETLAARSLLADTLVRAEDFGRAEPLAAAVLAEQKSLFGTDDPDSLQTEAVLAEAQLRLTRYEEALPLAHRVVEVHRAQLGADHPDTLKAMRLESTILYRQGKYAAVKDIEAQILEANRRVLGENHPATLEALSNLAQTLVEKGETKEGTAMLGDAYRKLAQVFGEEHRSTTMAANNYAMQLADLGDLDGARALQEKILEIRRRTLGPEAPPTLRCATNLMLTLAKQRHYDEARQLGERTLAAQRRVLGPEHGNTLYTWRSLAQVDLLQGRYEAALQQFEAMRAPHEKASGADGEDTLRLYTFTADAQYHLGRFAEAEALQTRTLETQRRIQGDTAPPTLETMHDLARTLHAEGRDPEALPLIRTAHAAVVEQMGADADEARAMEQTLHAIERSLRAPTTRSPRVG